MSQPRISREASWLSLSAAQSQSKKQRRIFMSKIWLITVGSGYMLRVETGA